MQYMCLAWYNNLKPIFKFVLIELTIVLYFNKNSFLKYSFPLAIIYKLPSHVRKPCEKAYHSLIVCQFLIKLTKTFISFFGNFLGKIIGIITKWYVSNTRFITLFANAIQHILDYVFQNDFILWIPASLLNIGRWSCLCICRLSSLFVCVCL